MAPHHNTSYTSEPLCGVLTFFISVRSKWPPSPVESDGQALGLDVFILIDYKKAASRADHHNGICPVSTERKASQTGGNPMTQITLPDTDLSTALDGVTTDHFFTPQQFQHDVDYYRAQRIAKSMLEAGLISLSQFDNLTELNRKSFSPFLADIFPNTVDKS